MTPLRLYWALSYLFPCLVRFSLPCTPPSLYALLPPSPLLPPFLLPRPLQSWRRDLLVDPQTSGGLLLAVEPGAAEELLAAVRAAGFSQAAAVGRLEAPGAAAAAGTVVLQP